MCAFISIIITSQPYQSLQLSKHIHWHNCTNVMYSPFFSSTQVIYSCGLGSPPHAIKKLFGCTCVTHRPSILPFPPPPSFYFSSVLPTGGELFHHATNDILLLVKVTEERLPDDCCHLSPLFPFQHLCFLRSADCADTIRAIAQGSICSAATLIIFSLSAKCWAKSLSECKWWFAKAMFLNDAFHGLSVMSWLLGFNWSI